VGSGGSGGQTGGSTGSGGTVHDGGSTADVHDSSTDSSVTDASVGDHAPDASLQDSSGHTIDWNAYFPLTSGSTANGDPGVTPDTSGHGYEATYGYNTFFTKSGMSLSGSDVSVAPLSSVPAMDVTGSYSISAWITMTDTTSWKTFLSADGTQVSEFYLQKRADTGMFGFTLLNADTNDATTGIGPPCIATAAGIVSANILYHLVGTRDASTGNDKIYVNGVAAGSANCPASRNFGWPATTLGIGHGMYSGAFADYFIGTISGVGFINRVLTGDEVKALFQAGPPS
jgi:hypothetical protein